ICETADRAIHRTTFVGDRGTARVRRAESRGAGGERVAADRRALVGNRGIPRARLVAAELCGAAARIAGRSRVVSDCGTSRRRAICELYASVVAADGAGTHKVLWDR